jgi:hypothetical protein
MTATMDIPLFGGQGTSYASTAQARQQALRDASPAPLPIPSSSSNPSYYPGSPACATLLAACHAAFHAELLSLSPTERALAGVDLRDFAACETVLALPTPRNHQPTPSGTESLHNSRPTPDQLYVSPYERNAVLAGTSLFLVHALRYLRFVEGSCSSTGDSSSDTPPRTSLTPFLDALASSNGVLGFSSGVLPACVAATSPDLPSYIAHAVEAYKVALWIGVRAEGWRAAEGVRGTTDRDTESLNGDAEDDAELLTPVGPSRTTLTSELYSNSFIYSSPQPSRSDSDSNNNSNALPWSVVVLGLGRAEAEERIRAFNSDAVSFGVFCFLFCIFSLSFRRLFFLIA